MDWRLRLMRICSRNMLHHSIFLTKLQEDGGPLVTTANRYLSALSYFDSEVGMGPHQAVSAPQRPLGRETQSLLELRPTPQRPAPIPSPHVPLLLATQLARLYRYSAIKDGRICMPFHLIPN